MRGEMQGVRVFESSCFLVSMEFGAEDPYSSGMTGEILDPRPASYTRYTEVF